MPIAIAMPKLGMTMQEGTVIEWRVALGAQVAKGDVVLSIESEKAEIEIEAPASGVLRTIYVGPGETVACGTLLAVLTDTADEPFDPEAFRRASEQPKPGAPTLSRTDPGHGPPPGPRTPTPVATQPHPPAAPVTPAARRRAVDLGIDPGIVPGSGPGGRVTREDVEAYAALLAARVTVADGVALDVPVQGAGDPVLLLPGFGIDVSAFARQVPALAEHYRTIGVNPRGVGFSDAPDTDRYDVATAAADAAAAAGGCAHVIGASLGAAVAIELALVHPERVRSLTLVTPFIRADARLLAVIDAWHRLAAEASHETLARSVLPWLFSQQLLTDDARRERTVRALVQTAARVPARTLERWAAGLRAWSGTRERDLGRIAAPTLVIAAGEDLLTPGAERIADAIPAARCVVIPGAGHAVGLEAPDAVNTAILEHLAAADH